MTSAALLTASGALLLRARMVLRRWRRTHDDEGSMSFGIGPGSVSYTLNF